MHSGTQVLAYKNVLILNEGKTEVILFGPSDAFNASKCNFGSLTQWVTPFAKNLGFWFDSGLKLNKQKNGVVKVCFFNLRPLAKVKPLLSSRNFKKVVVMPYKCSCYFPFRLL